MHVQVISFCWRRGNRKETTLDMLTKCTHTYAFLSAIPLRIFIWFCGKCVPSNMFNAQHCMLHHFVTTYVHLPCARSMSMHMQAGAGALALSGHTNRPPIISQMQTYYIYCIVYIFKSIDGQLSKTKRNCISPIDIYYRLPFLFVIGQNHEPRPISIALNAIHVICILKSNRVERKT